MTKAFSMGVDVPADVETTWALLTSPRWPKAQDASLRDGSTLVSAAATADGGAVVVISRRLPDGIPSMLQRFAPQDGRVTQTDTWGPAGGGVRRGTWRVEFAGAPGELRGETSLTPVDGGCRWTVDGTVKVEVPLIGGQAERFLAPLLDMLAVRQGEVLREQVG